MKIFHIRIAEGRTFFIRFISSVGYLLKSKPKVIDISVYKPIWWFKKKKIFIVNLVYSKFSRIVIISKNWFHLSK